MEKVWKLWVVNEEANEISFKKEEVQPNKAVSVVSGFGYLCSYPFHRMSESLHWSFLPIHPGEYGQKKTNQLEWIRFFLRFFGFQAAFFGISIPFATLGIVSHGISNIFNRTSYRVDEGSFSGELNKNTKVMTLNPRMHRSLPKVSNHGVTPGSDRFARLVSTVKDNNPDILFLLEMNATVRHALRQELEDRYHYFFSNMGRRTLGFEASFFIAFRGKLESKPKYVRFTQQGLITERGFMYFEANQTHYSCTANPTLEDLEEMKSKIKEGKKVVFLMETTFKKDGPEYAYLKEQGFPSVSVQETNAPSAHLYGEEAISEEREGVFMGGAQGETDIVSMHQADKIDEAFSDKSMFLTKILA